MPHYQIVLTQEFRQPVTEVFDCLADHNRLRDVFGVPVARIHDGTDSPNGVGSIRRIGPWPVGIQETVTAVVPNKRIEYRVSRFGGPIRKHRGSIEFDEIDGGSRVTWRIDFDALPGVGALVSRTLEQGLGKGLKRYARRAA
jgi:uncharacterized protein YndB with AHSA1/START domain